MTSWTSLTGSADETVRLGRILGSLLTRGDFVALIGDLGSGKTQFAKGVAEGIGVERASAITSPTYTLLNTYDGRIPLYHFDLYRLSGDADVADLGFHEYFHGQGASLVEWADRLEEELPEEHLSVTFTHMGEGCRQIMFTARGVHFEGVLGQLSQQWETSF